MRGIEVGKRRTAPRLNGRTRCNPLHAIPVEGADPGKRGVARMPPRIEVADLGVHHPMDRFAIDQCAATDPGADRHVDQVLHVSRGAPTVLREGRRIDIGIEADGAREFARQPADDVGPAPPGLRSAGDVSIVRVAPVELNRSEGSDAYACERAEFFAAPAQK